MERLVRFGVSVEEELVREFDEMIKSKGYSSRSEAIRDLMREYLVENRWETGGDHLMLGSLTLLYDHESHDITDKLTHLQHQYQDVVIAATHVHVDEHNCLEVVLLRGTADRVRQVADRLSSLNSVKLAKLNVASVGGGV
ncbi:nickel-responsive transcriptional regulator NikR [Coprothermobacteraceae bacterium]|nr:nickel-responsive transcriptional regulator NikR [Coprothermobacteraceae bacterium]